MPMILPTPQELACLSWHERARIIRRLRAYMRELDEYVEPVTQTKRTARGAKAIAAYERAWGEQVRAEARRLAGES